MARTCTNIGAAMTKLIFTTFVFSLLGVFSPADLMSLSEGRLFMARSAHAADLVNPDERAIDTPEFSNPAIPRSEWSGPYGGFHMGIGAFTNSTMDWGDNILDDPNSGIELKEFSGLVGGQIGYNRQIDQLIWGLEGDLAWTGFDKKRAYGGNAHHVKAQMDWLATARGRLGLATGNGMAYFTGGLAMAQVTHCANAADFCSANDDENVAWDGTQFGLITGFGVEARLSEYVSLKGEYLYMRLADKNVVYKIDANSNTIYDVDFSNQSHLIRMGLNFHLNPMVIDDRASSAAWDGFYAGIHAGLGAFTGRAQDWERGVYSDPDGDINLNGFAGLAGVQTGYNHRIGNVIYGLEGDVAWTGFDEGRSFEATNATTDESYSSARMDWLATMRGRLGVTDGNGMVYITTGLAMAHVRHCANRNDSGVTPCSTPGEIVVDWDGVRLGLVVGAGVEARLSKNLSLKSEYLYVQLDDRNVDYINDIALENIDFGNHAHMLRLGLNYHLAPMAVNETEQSGPWSGFYVGLHGGAGAFTGTTMDWDEGVFSDPDASTDINALAALSGVQLGYNRQMGNVVYGLEADIAWTSFDDDALMVETPNYVSAKMDWLATVRGRLGLTTGNGLAYVTGGVALAQVSHCASENVNSPVCGDNGDDNSAELSKVQPGFVAGIGAETQFSDRISIKGEYLYVQIADKNVVYEQRSLKDADFGSRAHLFRVGLNYRFN